MKFLRFDDLEGRGVPFTRAHLDRLQKAGKFPKKVKLGDNCAAYVESEIEAWIAARCAERDAA
jgi:prophage regulatory protein